MQLDDKIPELETRIVKDAVGVSWCLEKELLEIIGGPNLEDTPHMKFFWEQQMMFLQEKKMGRLYHPQIITASQVTICIQIWHFL